jgi:trk system potassium uptake protein TrkA
MKVIICGAGQVGYGIAEHLAAEGNDVAVIDTAADLVQHISDNLDVRGFVGHGAHPDMLDRAGAENADMIIAVTYHDEVNMVACQVAHSIFNIPQKIARVRAQSYREPHWQNLFSRDHMPIDVIISPEIEVGESVLRRLNLPGTLDVYSFDEGRITAIGIHCHEECPILDTPLEQLTELFPDLFAMVVGISRDHRLIVASKKEQLLAGDDVYLVVRADQVERTMKIFGHKKDRASRVVIAGAGNIGRYVAQRLEKLHPFSNLKLVEIDRQVAVRSAETLNRTVVLNGSALDEEILREADIRDADIMIALTNDDQVNILASVLAKRLGCRQNLCLINNRSYMTIVDSLGIDAHLNPRSITISRILQHVRRGRIKGVYSIEDGAAELIEAEALQTSPLVGKALQDLELPEGIRIGAIIRKNEMIAPQGTSEIQQGDRVIVFALGDQVHEVEQMFRVSLDYF